MIKQSRTFLMVVGCLMASAALAWHNKWQGWDVAVVWVPLLGVWVKGKHWQGQKEIEMMRLGKSNAV